MVSENNYYYTAEHLDHIERGWIDDDGRCVGCGREMYARVAEAARRIQNVEQLIADIRTNPDRYLLLSEQLVEAKRDLRVALAAAVWRDANPDAVR